MTFAAGGDEGGPPWLTDRSAGPLVYVTFGTVFNRDASVVSTAVEALRDLPVRVLVTVGPGRDPATLADQPANVHVARYIAQTEVLPHCAAVVSHARSGTFLAALGRGLPRLMLPQAADQFLNAAAGARTGAGVAIAPARAERRAIAAMPAPAAVAEAIERHFS